ncbi:MAG: type II toxin-antitoxin system death-on-curing family toxin [Clostridia bacterium]|nr:type II toxin-antitoxin system death-on-curing family toxin [Clostridia bacterium]
MRKISFDEAVAIHTMLCEKTGGDAGLRDEGLLRSALDMPFMCFGGNELYPDVYSKAARLCHSLVLNHAFVDGNKRIGMLLCLTFLKLNGAEIHPDVADVANMGLAIARGDVTQEEILTWLLNNLR